MTAVKGRPSRPVDQRELGSMGEHPVVVALRIGLKI